MTRHHRNYHVFLWAVLIIGMCSLLYYGIMVKKSIRFEFLHDLIAGNTVDLVFVGDIMLSRNIGKTMKEKNDWTYHFADPDVRHRLRSADLTFANLESVISTRGTLMGSIYSFRADPRTVVGLSYAGIDVVSLANNHVWDYGGEALSDTFDLLTVSEIGYVGAGVDYTEAHRPLIKEVHGTKIAYLAYTNLIPRGVTVPGSEPAVAYLDMEQVIPDIAHAKTLADVVIVSYHWGEEYETVSNDWQKRIARQTIDAGAEMVIGHHPHVMQELERYNGGLIAYSLGNFVFDQNFSEDTGKGMILKVTLKDMKVAEVEEEIVTFEKDFKVIAPK